MTYRNAAPKKETRTIYQSSRISCQADRPQPGGGALDAQLAVHGGA